MAGAAIIVQFILFKICYPFADYFNDSFTYINAAAHHHAISVRPIGYSRFLALVHRLTIADTAVVFLQYLTLQLGALLLFFTIRFSFPLQKKVSHWLFGILLFNPVVLYISNYISSDALYIGLSLTWFSLLIRIIHRPRWIQLIPLAGLLFIIFMLRYAALSLPAIALLALLFARRNWLFRGTAITVTLLPLFIAMQRIKHLTKKETNTAVFSAFSGWMAANNALHMYPYINVRNEDFSSRECVALNKIIKQYFDTVARPYPVLTVNYMWNGHSPLKTYMHDLEKRKNIRGGYFEAWHAAAPVFLEYSSRLVRQHPVAYAHYFMWPNATAYFLPPLESLLSYNEMRTTVDSTAIKWFRYTSERVGSLHPSIQGKILSPVPWLFLLINIVFCGLLAFLMARRKKYALSPVLLRTLLLAGAFWIINFCFSLYAAPIVFRFQLFPMIVYSAFSLLMINVIVYRRHHDSLQ